MNVDFRRHLAHHLHFVHLRELLQAIVHLREIDAENVFSFAQPGGFQDLLALQGAVGLHLDLAQAIIGILEEEALRSQPHAEIERRRKARGEHDLRDDDEHAAVAMLRRLARPHLHIEQDAAGGAVANWKRVGCARAGVVCVAFIVLAPRPPQRKFDDPRAQFRIADAGDGRRLRQQTRLGHSRDGVDFEHRRFAALPAA